MSIGHGSGIIEKNWTDALWQQIEVECTIVNRFNIPLGGGSSVDGKTIYIDRSIPESYKQKGGAIVPVLRYLAIHEFVENRLLNSGITYLPAHAAATASELAALQDDGYDISQYDAFWDKWLKVAAKNKIGDDTPPDLEMAPYESE